MPSPQALVLGVPPGGRYGLLGHGAAGEDGQRLRADGERSNGLPVAYWYLGDALALAGRPEEAIDSLKEAMRWAPDDRQIFLWLLAKAKAHFAAERYADARDSALRSIELFPHYWWTHQVLAASYGQLGLSDEARVALNESLRLKSTTLEQVSTSPYLSTMDTGHRGRYVAGLSIAGME